MVVRKDSWRHRLKIESQGVDGKNRKKKIVQKINIKMVQSKYLRENHQSRLIE